MNIENALIAYFSFILYLVSLLTKYKRKKGCTKYQADTCAFCDVGPDIAVVVQLHGCLIA